MIKILLCSNDSSAKKYFKNMEDRLPLLNFSWTFFEECKRQPVATGKEIFLVEIKNSNDLNQIKNWEKSFKDLFLFFSWKNLEKAVREKLTRLYIDMPIVSGILDIDQPLEFHLPVLANSFRSLLSERIDLNNVSQQMNRIVGRSLAELQRLKKLHEKVVPMRQESFKGLNILSKFGAGESSGGEFFDIVKGDKQFLVLLTSSSSYVVSSMLLTHFEYFRDMNEFSNEDMEKFLSELAADIRERGLNDSDDRILEIFLMRIDLGSLQIEGHQFGEFELKSLKGSHTKSNELPLDEMFFEKSYFKSRLDRGEKIIILSPGVHRNFDMRKEELPKNFYGAILEMAPEQMINEIFFQMKKEVEGDFLDHDATVLYLEVNSNVIVQV